MRAVEGEIRNYRLWIGGRWQEPQKKKEIRSPYTGKVVAHAGIADASQVEEALQAASAARKKFAESPRHLRSQLLAEIANQISLKKESFVESMIQEAGKPRTLSEGEVNRAITTFTYAAEEARRLGGELIVFDGIQAAEGFDHGMSVWFPRGVILGIAPFNFPLNLVAHKVAPALACGAPILIKPPHQAPGCAILLAEIFENALKEIGSPPSLPREVFQVLSAENEVIGKAIEDPRVAILSFTGSGKVGWMLQKKAVGKKVFLELGGNAATIIHEDADLKRAASRVAYGAFAYAGQICISVQRVFVHKKAAKAFQEALKRESSLLRGGRYGDPSDPQVLVGPLIDEKAVDRVMSWIDEARDAGASVLFGGRRGGASGSSLKELCLIEPTILSGVGEEQKLSCDEVFGPVVGVESYDSFDEALEKVNASRFGLQAGLFTSRYDLIQKAFHTLEVGALIVNEIPTFRSDSMPYGGVKESGLGREGVRYAMEEFSERRLLAPYRLNP